MVVVPDERLNLGCWIVKGSSMGKTILYRLFGLGSIPKNLRPVLQSEGIIISDEGIGGWFVTKNLKAPGRRSFHRKTGFSGCLVVTKKRIVSYTYARRQINIPVDDPKLAAFRVDLPKRHTVSLSFESSVFHDDWQGVIELRFNTEKAQEFFDVLSAIGVQHGSERLPR
jgi:hypothetical protein